MLVAVLSPGSVWGLPETSCKMSTNGEVYQTCPFERAREISRCSWWLHVASEEMAQYVEALAL